MLSNNDLILTVINIFVIFLASSKRSLLISIKQLITTLNESEMTYCDLFLQSYIDEILR